VQLTGSIDHPRMTGRHDRNLDVTELMQRYCNSRPAELNQLSGFVFKSRSPSCGLYSTPVFIEAKCISESGRGMFARAMTEAIPELPVIEETDLESADKYEWFLDSVIRYLNGREIHR
jgi:uncharacterized protein YbbK (DUF523 family)